jgi:betaine-aldehyde dehydrogenase
MTLQTVGHFIAGKWITDGPLVDSVNPADDSILGQFHAGSGTLVDQAAQIARDVFFHTTWAHAPRQRAQTPV